MTLTQISIFLENRSGRMAKIMTTLGQAGVNIRAMSLADTSDFGILRLIVNDTEKGIKSLKDAGFTIRLSEVIAVEVKDRPGELGNILTILEKADMNVEYMYSFVQKSMESAILIFRFDDPAKAIQKLTDNGIGVVENSAAW